MATALPSHSSIASSSSFKSNPPVKAATFRLSGGRPSLASFQEFRGLKIQMPASKLSSVSMGARNSRVLRRCGGRIVCEAQEIAIDIAAVTDETWQSFSLVLKADGLVLVEFWAPWCGPRRMIYPAVAELSAEYAGKLKFFRLNTNLSPTTASKYGIRSILTIMMFINGEKRDPVIGAVPKTTLTTTIEKRPSICFIFFESFLYNYGFPSFFDLLQVYLEGEHVS